MMRIPGLIPALLTCCALLTVPGLHAEPLVLVTHPESPLADISREDAAALYLDQQRGLDGLSRVTPLDLKDKAARARFYEQVAQRSLSQVRAYWSKLVFTGKGRPPKAYSPEELTAYLQENGDAVGYLPQSRVGKLKPLLVIPE